MAAGPLIRTDQRPELALVFDFGTRRIGVATANTLTGMASGLVTLPARNGQPESRQLDQLIREWQPQILVIGLPYNEDGSESPMTERAREFAAGLFARYRLPTELVDERLTSAEAESVLREARQDGYRTRRTRKEDIDRTAARLIGESWLRTGTSAANNKNGS